MGVRHEPLKRAHGIAALQACRRGSVADGLGLKLQLVPTDWANWPLATQSGDVDVTISNVTVTEERKQLFDFSSYRVDTLAFLAAADSKSRVARGNLTPGLPQNGA